MTENSNPTTRRTILLGAALMTGLPILAASGAAQAGGVTQANAKYQTMPKGAQQCSKCNYFLPPTDPKAATGHCKVVAGDISPNGWCQLFAAKHA